MRVEEVMTSHVRTCRPTDNLHVVMQTMWDHDLGALPVVDEAGRALAMITDRDVAMAAYTQGKPLHELQVRSAMSKDVITADVDDRLSSAERTMRVHQLHRLPVVDESSHLVGILSLNDIARQRAAAGTTRPLDQRELVTTLAAIARKRGTLSLEEYALQQMVSFDTSSASKAAKSTKTTKTVTSVKKRERVREASPRDSGVFPTAAAFALPEAAVEAG